MRCHIYLGFNNSVYLTTYVIFYLKGQCNQSMYLLHTHSQCLSAVCGLSTRFVWWKHYNTTTPFFSNDMPSLSCLDRISHVCLGTYSNFPLNICKKRTYGTVHLTWTKSIQDVQYKILSQSIVLISFPESFDSDWDYEWNTDWGKWGDFDIFLFLKGCLSVSVCVGWSLSCLSIQPLTSPFWAFRSILWPLTFWTIEARTFPSERRWSQQQEHEGCSWETNCLLCSRMDSPLCPSHLLSHTITDTITTHLCTVKSCQATGGCF